MKTFSWTIGTSNAGTNIKEVLAQKLQNPAIENIKKEKCIQNLKIIFEQ